MTSRRHTETTTYNENLHHASRGIAKYYLYTAYKAALQCWTPPPTPVKLPVSPLPTCRLFKSVTAQD